MLTSAPYLKIQTYIGAERFGRPSRLAALAPNCTSHGKHCEVAGASWRDFPGIPGQYMSAFLKKMSNLGQNLSAIASREAFAVLEKPGAFRQGGMGQTAQVRGYQLIARGAQALSPGGWGGSQVEAFCSVKLPLFFAEQPWPVMPSRLSGW